MEKEIQKEMAVVTFPVLKPPVKAGREKHFHLH